MTALASAATAATATAEAPDAAFTVLDGGRGGSARCRL